MSKKLKDVMLEHVAITSAGDTYIDGSPSSKTIDSLKYEDGKIKIQDMFVDELIATPKIETEEQIKEWYKNEATFTDPESVIAGGNVQLDNTGLHAYNNDGELTLELNRETGDTYFGGELKAATGNFEGSITGGDIDIGDSNFTVDSDGNMVAVDGSFSGDFSAVDDSIIISEKNGDIRGGGDGYTNFILSSRENDPSVFYENLEIGDQGDASSILTVFGSLLISSEYRDYYLSFDHDSATDFDIKLHTPSETYNILRIDEFNIETENGINVHDSNGETMAYMRPGGIVYADSSFKCDGKSGWSGTINLSGGDITATGGIITDVE